jgi:hypothetical protein
MKRLWTFAFVMLIVLAGATAAQASETDTAKAQEAVLLAQIFSTKAPACPTPEVAPLVDVPNPVPTTCGSFTCTQPCRDACRMAGCATYCVDPVACECDCACP